MEIVTPFEIYLICQLDDLKAVLCTIAVLGTVIGTVSSIAILSCEDADDIPKSLKRGANILACLGILCIGLAVATPSSKTMAMMKVIPAIANNEDVQGECKELYGLAKQGLKELVTDDKEGEK